MGLDYVWTSIICGLYDIPIIKDNVSAQAIIMAMNLIQDFNKKFNPDAVMMAIRELYFDTAVVFISLFKQYVISNNITLPLKKSKKFEKIVHNFCLTTYEGSETDLTRLIGKRKSTGVSYDFDFHPEQINDNDIGNVLYNMIVAHIHDSFLAIYKNGYPYMFQELYTI